MNHLSTTEEDVRAASLVVVLLVRPQKSKRNPMATDAVAERPLSNRLYGHVREFACGSFAGVGLILAGHPFDTIKVRLQSEGGYGRFKGPVDCLVTTLKQEKVFGLYKGAMGPLIGQGLVSSVQFGLYSQFLPLVQRVSPSLG